MTKKELRKQLLERRSALSDSEVGEKSLLIQREAIDLKEFRLVKIVALYSEIQKEVSTGEIFAESLRRDKVLLYPRVVRKGKRLIFAQVKGKEDLEKGNWGIMEPRIGLKEFSPRQIDLVFIPGVAFDREGRRLGYGQGYYDRAAEGLRKDCIKIALAFDFQVIEGIPNSSKDLRVGKIITERRIIEIIK
jgi:5-formyltetrahydrofolate cyclo-ligase